MCSRMEETVASEVDVLLTIETSKSPVVTDSTVKKPTRQWAAWTRQEEENFFCALRQVGKNFEQITKRVSSKNKNQVRHYYYRLVRRMKKLLGPGFSFDAKNSKDTVAAMLRWWSLLEKFSCSASKLHLKPRRCKIFVEALGNQLLKDRKRTRRKYTKGELSLISSSVPINIEGNELCAVKPVNGEAPDCNRLASTRGLMFKRIMEGNTNCRTEAVRSDLSVKKMKQKKKSGPASAAYRKWEKAAIAGVSLVAAAAEQLERDTLDPSLVASAETISVLRNETCRHTDIKEAEQSTSKLKLQLFPINEATRKALEKEEHNPHLQLTLSCRKRISSVLEHLNRKWGSTSIALGDLMLVPYNAHELDIANCQRWTLKDSAVVSDLFLSVGSPANFRLRYGWFTIPDPKTGTFLCCTTLLLDNCASNADVRNDSCRLPDHVSGEGMNLEQCQVIPESVNQSSQLDVRQHVEDAANHVNEVHNGKTCSSMTEEEWADSLTEVSVGVLLEDEPNNATFNCIGPSFSKTAPCLEEAPQSCDSFDAAVEALVSSVHQAGQAASVCHSTIWNAEDTCDQFSFSISPELKQHSSNTSTSNSPGVDHREHTTGILGFDGVLQNFVNREAAPPCEQGIKTTPLEDPKPLAMDSPDETKNVILKDQCLADIYWPDSLGPFDLETPGIRHQANDLVFCDSQNSWSRMMESSLDAIRNLSFFHMDRSDL